MTRSTQEEPASAERTQVADERSALLRAGASGVLWQGLAQVVGKLVVLGTTVVLARLLAPEEFGLVALSLVLITYAEAFADAGVAQALVYLPRTRENLRAALLSSVVAGVGLVLAAMAAAPAIASFFDRPDVTPLARLLALSLLAASLGALPESLLRRDLRFRRLTVSTVARVVVTGAVSIALATAGLGAWALAWGTVAGSLVYAVANWLLLPQRPDLAIWRATRRDLGRVLGYGLPVAGSNLLSRLIFNVDYLVIGSILGATALGYYTLAFRIPELLVINVFFVLSAVAFPMFSRLQGDLARMRSAYLFSVRLHSLYGICAGVGLAVVASLVVPVVFGPRWEPAVASLVPLALYAACRSIGVGANEVYKALGRPGLALSLSVVRLAVLVPALVVGALHWGVVGVAWAQVVTSLAMAVLMQGRAARVLSLRWRQLGRAVAPALLAGAAIAAVGLPLARLPLPAPSALAVVIVAGAAAASLVVFLLERRFVRELLQVARRRSGGTT
ncbi:oligosaccharide flippase family protein [Geodermatophilus sp. SYSU D00742]